MEIIQMTSSEKTSARHGAIEYIVIHYTAGATSKSGTARANARWYANKNNKTEASADFFVDDAEIVQYNPDPLTRYCLAVGGKRYSRSNGARLFGVVKNSNSISIEICSANKSGKMTYANDPAYFFTDAVLHNALWLTKYLMNKYHIDADHVIRHYDVTGKQCPGIVGWNEDSGSEAAWQRFHAALTIDESEDDDMDVAKFSELYGEMRKSWQDNDAGTWSDEARKWAVESGLIQGGSTLPDGSTNYMWQDILTREQMATLLYRFAKMMGKA